MLYLYDLQPSFPNETLLLADEILQMNKSLLAVVKNEFVRSEKYSVLHNNNRTCSQIQQKENSLKL